MLMDPHISQQNLGIQKAVLVLNQKVTRPELKFNLTLPEVDLGVYRFHYILVSYFTCGPLGDIGNRLHSLHYTWWGLLV